MTEIATLMGALAKNEGVNETHLSQVRVYRSSHARPREPLCYEQGIIIVGQGTKLVYYGSTMYEYNPENYLVLTVPIPAECEAHSTPEKPMLAMMIDIDVKVLNSIIHAMDSSDGDPFPMEQEQRGLFLTPSTVKIRNVVSRLLNVLGSKLESSVLGEALLRELYYRVLCGENGASLLALTLKNSNLARIDKALQRIHSSYNRSMDIDTLAALANMSPSSFHRAFRDVTSSSPIQYVKKIRLNKAKTLLMQEGSRVNEAASRVGYESTSQFSREFKRYFGTSPAVYINQGR